VVVSIHLAGASYEVEFPVTASLPAVAKEFCYSEWLELAPLLAIGKVDVVTVELEARARLQRFAGLRSLWDAQSRSTGLSPWKIAGRLWQKCLPTTEGFTERAHQRKQNRKKGRKRDSCCRL
jgi:hypothetical protein